MRWLCVLLSALLLVACGQTPRDSLAAGRQALADSNYDEALAAADAGLAGEPDPVTAWGLELVKLEALARGGHGDETVAQLEVLATDRPEQMPAAQYAASADQLKAAGQGPAAILVLDLGLKRFPEDATLLALIEEAKQAPAAGSEELDMLRSLGYVD